MPWRFRRADGELWGLAGIWSTWVNKATGEIHESYTMLTINADHHPLMRRTHRPDPKRPADMQDKRSVVPINLEDVDSLVLRHAGSGAAVDDIACVRAARCGTGKGASLTRLLLQELAHLVTLSANWRANPR